MGRDDHRQRKQQPRDDLCGFAEPHKWRPNEVYFVQEIGDQMLMSVSHQAAASLFAHGRFVRTSGGERDAEAEGQFELLGRRQIARATNRGPPLALTDFAE